MESNDNRSCTVGLTNQLEIKHTKEDLEHAKKEFESKMDAMMQRIEEKIDSMDTKIQSEFSHLNEKLDKLDKRINVLDKKMEGVDNLEKFVNEKIESSTKDKAFKFVKWAVVVLLGTTVVTVFGKYVLSLLGL